MIRARDAYLNSDHFQIQLNHQGVVQLSFGPTHICMNLDSAYDLQYRLAAFLADLELREYPKESENEDGGLFEGRLTLETLSLFKKSKKVDA